MVQNCKARKFTFSIYGPADFRAKLISSTIDGIELEIDHIPFWLQLVGEFNASNVLAAYSVLQLLGKETEKIMVALSAVSPALGRMQKIPQVQRFHLFIDYGHTPDAVEKTTATLRKLLYTGNKLITVMGCGGNRDTQKRPIIGKILANASDIAIFTHDNERYDDATKIIHEMQQGVDERARHKVIHNLDRVMAIKTAMLLAQPHDIVLICGRGHENYLEVKGERHYFSSDEEIVRMLLKDYPKEDN